MTEVILEKLTKWIKQIPIDEYFAVARARPPGLGKNEKFKELQQDMRRLIPLEGADWVHDIDVLIEPHQDNHQGQRWHEHDEWTAIFYVDPGDPVVPIRIRDAVTETEIRPEPGDCVVLPPNTEHKVASSRSDRPRLSFAMLVRVPGRPCRFAN